MVKEKWKKWYKLSFYLVQKLYKIQVIKVENGYKRIIPNKDLFTEMKIEKGTLLCSNHLTAKDPVFVAYPFGLEKRYAIAKKELFNFLTRKLLITLGALPIDRGKNKKKIDSTMNLKTIKTSEKLLKDNKAIVVFIEGTRTKRKNKNKNKENTAKEGVSFLSRRTNCNIIPIYLEYIKNKHKLKTQVNIYIGKTINYQTLLEEVNPNISKEERDKTVADKVYQKIKDLPKI